MNIHEHIYYAHIKAWNRHGPLVTLLNIQIYKQIVNPKNYKTTYPKSPPVDPEVDRMHGIEQRLCLISKHSQLHFPRTPYLKQKRY
jgi:hypothetical protein